MSFPVKHYRIADAWIDKSEFLARLGLMPRPARRVTLEDEGDHVRVKVEYDERNETVGADRPECGKCAVSLENPLGEVCDQHKIAARCSVCPNEQRIDPRDIGRRCLACLRDGARLWAVPA